MDNVALLKTVLSAPGVSPHTGEDAALLKNLLASAPKLLRHNRKRSLFEAMRILDLENPYSDYIAWLFDPLGPLTQNWLLRSLLEHVSSDRAWADDATVEREVSVGIGRLDILINWPDFKLIIENKVRHKETEEQIAKYLRSSNIATRADGLIVFLTLDGRRPTSVPEGDERVVALSYADLIKLIEDGLHAGKEPDARGRAFATELRHGIRRLLKLREDPMKKPSISESTKIYVGQAKRLAEIKTHAIDEFADFLQWMYSEAKRRLETLLKSEVVSDPGRYVALFRLPEWKIGDIGFGFYFGSEHDPTKRLLSELASGPWVGIGAWRLDDEEDQKGCEKVVDLLLPRLAKVWPDKQDLREPDWSMALWREVRIPEDGDLDQWAEAIFAFFDKLASTLTPVLIDFAKKHA